MPNLAMRQKLERGECIDISRCERDGKFYIITNFKDDVDYCDAAHELWIWSIGRRKSDGVVHASTGSDLYQNPAYECLWLR